MRRRLFALVAILYVIWPAAASAQDSAIALTVYNEGRALIRDQRSLSLEQGINEITIYDIAATIDPTSVSFHSLSDPAGMQVLEQSFRPNILDAYTLLAPYIGRAVDITVGDALYSGELLRLQDDMAVLQTGGSDVVFIRLRDIRGIKFPTPSPEFRPGPELRLLLQADVAGEQDTLLTYLAGGMNWSADYNLSLNQEATALDLKGWITLSNSSGHRFDEASLKLVAGSLRRIQPQAVRADSRMMALEMQEEASAGIAQRDLFEYQLYEIERPVSISGQEIKQIEFVSGEDIAATTYFVFDGSPHFDGYYSPIDYPEGFGSGGGAVSAVLLFNTGDESGIGADLPAGRVRVYQTDVDGAGLLIGENRIEHSPEGEELRIPLGKAFDLVGERTRTAFETVSRDVIRESFEINLRSRKEAETVEVRVPERLYRWSDWQILESSAPFEKLNASTIEFRVSLEPGAEAALTYTVQYKFPGYR